MKLLDSKVRKVFNNAPIVEAVIDIIIPELPEDQLTTLEKIEEPLASDFPSKKPIYHSEMAFEFTEGIMSGGPSASYIKGYQFWSEDEKELVTARRDGFSYNKLKPYSEWEKVKQKMLAGWGAYSAAISPASLSQLVVRNINLIEIPETQFELKKYFEAPPNLPDSIDRPLENFLIRYVIAFSEIAAKCTVTMATHPSAKEGCTTILFDIEAIRIVDSLLTLEQIDEILTSLNNAKDMIFFESLTSNCIGLFE